LHIPRVFEVIYRTDTKVEEIVRAIDTHQIEIAGCVVVNDSYTEMFALEARIPNLRCVTPDALAVLGREGIA
jgi:hypothetical protein